MNEPASAQLAYIDSKDTVLGKVMMWSPVVVGAIVLAVALALDNGQIEKGWRIAMIVGGISGIIMAVPTFQIVNWTAQTVVGNVSKLFGDRQGPTRPYIVDMMGSPTYFGVLAHAVVAAGLSVAVMYFAKLL